MGRMLNDGTISVLTGNRTKIPVIQNFCWGFSPLKIYSVFNTGCLRFKSLKDQLKVECVN